MGLHQYRLQPGHLVGTVNVVRTERRIDQVTGVIIGHLFAMTVTQRLSHATFDLPTGGDRINGHAAIDGHDQLRHGHLAGLYVDFYLGKLPGKRRRRIHADERGRSHDLPLLVLVE